MGRITDALSKLKLNSNVTDKPFNKLSPKEMVSLFYHLAEVYDAEALMPETTVKKKLQVFKNFARVHSLIHLLPTVKEMKNQKKCARLVNNLLDMLEEKYEGELYTRKSWPVACKKMPKIESAFSAGQYNIDSLNLNPDAVPPGVSEDNKMNEFPGEKVETPGTKQNGVAEKEDCSNAGDAGVKTVIAKASPSGSKATDLEVSANVSTVKAHELNGVSKHDASGGTVPKAKNSTAVPNKSGAGSGAESSKITASSESKKDPNSTEQVINSSITTKRQLETSVPSSGSKEIMKKVKTEHNACEQFIEAIEDLSRSRPIVEITGWSEGIFSNHRVWLSIQQLIFTRILLGKELRKYKAKKVEGSRGTKVIVEKAVSQEDLEAVRVKLTKVMEQVRKAVPVQLSEDIKCAVNSSCENVKLVMRDLNEL